MLIGTNVQGGEIAYNTCVQNKADDWGIVLKGGNIVCHHNIVTGPHSLYISGSRGCLVTNNSCYNGGTALPALKVADNQDSTTPINNEIYNNVFLGIGASALCVSVDEGEEYHWDTYFDYNCYWTDNATVATLGTINCDLVDGLVDLLTAWSVTWTAANATDTRIAFSANDSHSLVMNPALRNPAGGDFVPTNNLLLYSGKPDADGRASYIGALHPKVGEPFDKNRWRYSGMTLGGHW